ncbi:MAG: ErfK/YbiS/YcfS/YnhG family protein [Gemmatimonadetes bacterium]|nr:ErfK/YbiS/YcfS/YnhG family protein [Gemmatimonadota bacterium]
MTPRATTALARKTTLVMLGVFLLGACSKANSARKAVSRRFHHAPVWTPAAPAAVKGVPQAEMQAALTTRLDAAPPAGVKADSWRHTRALYKSLGVTPLWLTASGLDKDRARVLTDAVIRINDDALRTDEYPISELSAALTAVQHAPNPTAAQWADVDVLLSTVYAALGSDMLVGQIAPKSVGQSWHINPLEDDVDSALVHSLGDTLERGLAEMRPPDADYAALQKELTHYRDIAMKPDWPVVPKGKTLRTGQSDSPSRMTALRSRLFAEGLIADSTGGAVYDSVLAGAIGQFQAHHAITVDKTLSPETVNSLNVSAAYRLGQIAANLERMRWMPRNLGDRYIYVNVPAFHLTAYDSGEKALDMKVIVGQDYEDKATPVFSDSMETVVFRPYWLITPSIQSSEIGPRIAADPAYMDRENLEYYKDGGVQRIRQKPGPKNALGFVKFLFPNDYNIYLHDTPNHELFNKDVRAFSHGCIRVEKPTELAQWVLGWDAARVQQAMADGSPDNTSIKLPRKLPVYITYGTAYVRDGQLYFGNDLYHRDDKLVKAAAEAALPGAAAREKLEELKKIAAN